VGTVERTGQYWPMGQSWQSPAAEPPVPLRKVPAGHEVGVVVPAGQYWPWGQARQSVTSLAPTAAR